MTDQRTPNYLQILEAADLIGSGRASSEELTRALLARIQKLDGHLGSFVEVMDEEALGDARRADEECSRGLVRGPLHGVPIAVKDIFGIEGHPMAAGMAMRKNSISSRDATAIRRLRAAGAILLGRLTMTEGGYAEHRDPFPAPLNPWSTTSWSGASSSGSAVAVAAGLAFLPHFPRRPEARRSFQAQQTVSRR